MFLGLQWFVASVQERVDIPRACQSGVPVSPSPSAQVSVAVWLWEEREKDGVGERWKFCRNVEQRITPTVFDMEEQGLLPVCDIV